MGSEPGGRERGGRGSCRAGGPWPSVPPRLGRSLALPASAAILNVLALMSFHIQERIQIEDRKGELPERLGLQERHGTFPLLRRRCTSDRQFIRPQDLCCRIFSRFT